MKPLFLFVDSPGEKICILLQVTNSCSPSIIIYQQFKIRDSGEFFVIRPSPPSRRTKRCWRSNQHLDYRKRLNRHILNSKEILMICFMGLVDGINSDLLNRYFGQIHNCTKEDIVTWCGSKVQVFSLWGEEIVRWEENQ